MCALVAAACSHAVQAAPSSLKRIRAALDDQVRR